MKELSIFIDESGDFGEYDYHSPYYIIAMIMHDQSINISKPIEQLDYELAQLGFSNHCIHTGPIIRQEEEYRYLDIAIRKKIFNKMVAFVRQINFTYQCFHIEKKHISDVNEVSTKLSKSISAFIKEHYSLFLSYETVKIYYDNGQTELSRILASVFHNLLPHVEFRRVIPSEYRLFQVADFICTFKLLELKSEKQSLSKSEIRFFGNPRDFKKNYLKPLHKKSLIK